MAKLSILAGSTSKLIDVFIQDSSSVTGAGLTGLTNASGSLTWYYYIEGAASSVQVTSIASMTLGTWVTKGFIVIDGTNMPGCYQLGVPNAALTGGKSVIMVLKGATNMVPLVLEIELTATDNQTANLTAAQIATGVWQDTTAGDFTTALSVGKSVMNGVSLGTGLTVNALTTNNDKTSYSLAANQHVIVDSGTVTTVTNQLTAAQIATGVWTDTTAGDFTTSASVGKSIMNGVALGTGLTVNDITTKTGYSLSSSQTFNLTGNITGNLSGSVGSVTTVSDKTGFSLTSAYDPSKTASQAGDAMALTSGERNSTADALLDRAAGVETSRTLRQTLRLMAAALLGKASGLAGTTATFRDTNDTKDRIVATVDSDGNRSAVTLDAS